MSLAKSVAGFIISSLFVIFLYLTITSYTLGNSLQKENIKEFMQSQTKGEAAQSTCEGLCNNETIIQQCEESCRLQNANLEQSCSNICLNESQDPEIKQMCIESCLSRANESQQYVSNAIDDIYSKNIVSGFSIDSILSILKNFFLFLIISIILGVSLFFVSEKPLSRIGNDFVVVAISLLAFAVIPMFIISPGASILNTVSEFFSQSLYQQLIAGIILLVVGIILVLIGKKKNK
jgi:ABC-type multidrug transport system fused ATPase/permease subunit